MMMTKKIITEQNKREAPPVDDKAQEEITPEVLSPDKEKPARKKEKEAPSLEQEEQPVLHKEKAEDPSPIAQEEQSWKEKYMRLYAELDNFKKRTTRNQLTWVTMASKEVMLSLLPILDDFERALESLDKKESEQTKQGISLIYQNLYKALQKKGLKVLDTHISGEFDPQHHEVLTQAPTEDPALKGKITKVLTKGYLLHNEIIRTAQVIIGT